jgi:Family of unknown function (DUF5908)
MALEISEIAIQMRVDEDGDEETDDAKKKKEKKDDDGCCDLDKGEIVDECVRRVLKILKEQRER